MIGRFKIWLQCSFHKTRKKNHRTDKFIVKRRNAK